MRHGQFTLQGWGGYPRRTSLLLEPTDVQEALACVRERTGPLGIRGLGRSYGDASLAPTLIDLRRARRTLDLDVSTGLLRADAGWSLDEVVRHVLPLGWMPVVLPGTRHVTLGGAVAADVHGKNHHLDGSFCRWVDELLVGLADGSIVACSRGAHAGLFRACCGGMGLAGLILEVRLRLRKAMGDHFRRRTLACADLDTALRVLKEASESHTVAWVDAACAGSSLGRCLVYLGEPDPEALPRPVMHRASLLGLPCSAPFNLVRPALSRAFNELVWRGGKRRHGAAVVQHYADFFWPLDRLAGWNRLYGKQGFLQFQCLLPERRLQERGGRDFHELLQLFLTAGGGSLAVMKTMGAATPDTAPIAFPGPGATLALDLPASAAGIAAVRAAQRKVVDWGGRIYLAKDALMSATEYRAMTPGLDEWRTLRDSWDPHGGWRTDLAQRLELT